jgi:hypothetical protein
MLGTTVVGENGLKKMRLIYRKSFKVEEVYGLKDHTLFDNVIATKSQRDEP